jgi:hypothetical protein
MFLAIFYSFTGRGPKMDELKDPRIGNRSDALDLLDTVIKRVRNPLIRKALEVLRDAIERGIV